MRVRGEFVWHRHDDTDELLLVLGGHLTIQLRDGDVELHGGALFVVPQGVEHCPRAADEAVILLFDPRHRQHRRCRRPLTAELREI